MSQERWTPVPGFEDIKYEKTEDGVATTYVNISDFVIVLAGFMRILKGEFLRTFTNRVVNIHPSLLPAFPGLEAWKQALDYGVKVTGCTVHFVDQGIETGEHVLNQVVCHGTRRAYFFDFQSNRIGLIHADPDRQHSIAANIFQQHDRHVGNRIHHQPANFHFYFHKILKSCYSATASSPTKLFGKLAVTRTCA